MPQIMEPDLPEPGLGENWLKVAVVEVVRIQNRPVRRWEHELVGDVVLTLQESFQKAPVPEFDQYPPQLSRQINSPALLALRGRVLAAHVIVLHNDEAIRILLVLPKLEVSPLRCDELATAKARAQCHQEQRVIPRTNLFCSLEELPGLRLR